MKKANNIPPAEEAQIRDIEMSPEADPIELPENAFRELAAGPQLS